MTGFEEGRPLFVRSPESKFTLANFMRTNLYTCLGAMRVGLNILIDQEHLPEEMTEVLGQLKKKAFHFVYSDQGKTYLAEGYGACPTTGYTIEVKELYETEHTVCLHTSLMGPATGEETKEITTFPYIVVEISETEKEVMFD